MRWIGHRIIGEAVILVEATTLADADAIAAAARAELVEHLSGVEQFSVRPVPDH